MGNNEEIVLNNFKQKTEAIEAFMSFVKNYQGYTEKQNTKMANSNNDLGSIPSYLYENTVPTIKKSIVDSIEEISKNIDEMEKVSKKATIQDCDNLVSLYQRLNEDLDINLSIEESILYLKELMISNKFSIIYDTGILNIPYVSNNSNDDERLYSIKKDKAILRIFNYIYNLGPKGVPTSIVDISSYINNSLISPRKYSSYGTFVISINHYSFNSPVKKLYDTLKEVNNNISASRKELTDEALSQVNSNMEYHKMQHELNSITNKLNDLKIRHRNLKNSVESIKSKIKDEYITANIDKIKCDIDSGYSEEIDESFNRVRKELLERQMKLNSELKEIESRLINRLSKGGKKEVKITSQDIINRYTTSFISEDDFFEEPIATSEPEYPEPEDEIGFDDDQSEELPI